MTDINEFEKYFTRETQPIVCLSCGHTISNVYYHNTYECKKCLNRPPNPFSEVEKEVILWQKVEELRAIQKVEQQRQFQGLVIHCDGCSDQITVPAALLFSPPNKNNSSCLKLHLCGDCYKKVINYLAAEVSKKVRESGWLRKVLDDAIYESERLARKNPIHERTTLQP